VITPSGLTSANYAITFNTGTLTIEKAALTVTAQSKTKTYGAGDPAFTATYSGFVNGEGVGALSGALTFSRAAGETVGNYLITPSGFTSANYAITFTTGTLTIEKAALSVTAESKTKIYGAGDPAFTATYAGFVNGESAAVLGGILTFSRAPGEDVGSYLITPSGLTSANYAITFNTGTLTIVPGATAPVILPIFGAGTGSVVIRWTSVSNTTYRVQFKSDLNEGIWTDLAGDVLATESLATKTDAAGAAKRFYRIQVRP